MDSDTPFKRLRHRYGKPLWTPIHRSRRHDLWGAWSQLVPARLSACIKVTADLPRWMAKIYDGFWPYISNTLHIYIYIIYTNIIYIHKYYRKIYIYIQLRVSGVNLLGAVHIRTFKRVLTGNSWVGHSKESTVLMFCISLRIIWLFFLFSGMFEDQLFICAYRYM